MNPVYESGIDSLRPVEERAVEDPREDYGHSTKAVCGVHAIVNDDSAHLFALGSASRGIMGNTLRAMGDPAPGRQL